MSEYRRMQAWRAGKKAALAGRPKTANNRERGTIFYDDWCDGWYEGEREKPLEPATHQGTEPSGDAGEGESEGWRPIETCPQEDLFIGAVQVRDNRSGAEWWERHLLALDGETGEIHADYEQGWALADYSWWLPFSTPPIPAALPSHQGAE